jgi:hypothetical protein
MIEISNNPITYKNGVEVKSREIQSEDKDFRDFIKGKITMDELFKKKEEKDGLSTD